MNSYMAQKQFSNIVRNIFIPSFHYAIWKNNSKHFIILSKISWLVHYQIEKLRKFNQEIYNKLIFKSEKIIGCRPIKILINLNHCLIKLKCDKKNYELKKINIIYFLNIKNTKWYQLYYY